MLFLKQYNMHTLWDFRLQITQMLVTLKIILKKKKTTNIPEWNTGEFACTAAFPLCWNHWNTRNVKLYEGALHAYNCDLASHPNGSHRCIWLRAPQCPIIRNRTWLDLNMCYFYLSFNRNVFIQHRNHKTLQNVRLYHATIVKLHSLTHRACWGLLPFNHLPGPRTPPTVVAVTMQWLKRERNNTSTQMSLRIQKDDVSA